MTNSTVLNDWQSEIWRDEQQQIQRLLELLQGWETEPADLEHLRQALNQLHELFLLVVVGEFNSGKSALINALLGQRFLAEGVTPTTDRIHIIKHGQSGSPEFISDDVRALRFPAELLREIHIVDTPGTNAVLRRHEAIARDFVPRSDMVIFVTSADRPFTESERQFLETIRNWGKKLVVAINKIDVLESDQAVEEVRSFVQYQVQRLLDFEPEVFPLSARTALRRAAGDDSGDLEAHANGFSAFRRALTASLTKESRVQLKLRSPLGVALKLARQYKKLADARLQVLDEDVQTLQKVERHLALYESDTRAEFERHLARIENELLQLRLRGEEFLDDRIRLLKIREMLSAGRMRHAFENQVVADTPEHVESHIREVIDWLVERELRQWRQLTDELSRRRETEALQDAARQAAGGFVHNRRQLLESLGAQAEQVIGGYDRAVEATRLTSAVQEAVAMVGIVEVGAIGLGLILKALLVGAAADATGVLAAGVLGVLGFAIIPYRRGVAKRQLREKLEDLRQRLRQVLNESFAQEMERSVSQLQEAIAPYRRFVLSEEQQLQGIHAGLDEVAGRLLALESALEAGAQS